MLDGEVPLLANCRLKVLIGDPDPVASVTIENVNYDAIARSCVAASYIAWARCYWQTECTRRAALSEYAERGIHSELLVGPSAFCEIRNCVSEANYVLATQIRA